MFGFHSRRALISNKTNFSIEQPFKDHSLTLQSLKSERQKKVEIRIKERLQIIKKEAATLDSKIRLCR